MKKVYTIVLAAALMLLGTQAKAQLNIGVGYLNSTEIDKQTSDNKEAGRIGLNGIFVGASYNIEIVNGLGVAPGFYVNALFAERTSSAGSRIIPASATITGTYRDIALNVPINLNYKYEVNSNFGIFAYAGPVFQYGVSCKTNWHGSISVLGKTYSDGYVDNHYDAQNGDSNPFNIYLGGGLGVQFGDIQLHVGYDHSLLNRSRIDGYKTSRSQIKVGVNFEF